MATPLPSSATADFFQALPVLPMQFSPQHTDASDDKVLARILRLYLPSDLAHVTQHIHRVGLRALDPAVLVHATDAETNHPVLRPRTTFGGENKTDPLWTTAGWQMLKETGYQEGVVAVSYDHLQTTYNRRVHAYALNHLWTCTSTMTVCPMSMTDGAATLLRGHLNEEDGDQPGSNGVFRKGYRRLTSRDPAVAWTSGQWMTERTGGSDVSGTESIATRITSEDLAKEAGQATQVDGADLPLGPWEVDGFKWFSSATDSDLTILLARTPSGLSAFLAPLRRRVDTPTSVSIMVGEARPPRTELNGIRIHSLKNKLGTKSLPTAELEPRGTRA